MLYRNFAIGVVVGAPLIVLAVQSVLPTQQAAPSAGQVTPAVEVVQPVAPAAPAAPTSSAMFAPGVGTAPSTISAAPMSGASDPVDIVAKPLPPVAQSPVATGGVPIAVDERAN
jgi:hypothetical protein